MNGDPLARDAASIAVATGIYAVSFGVLAVAAGFSVAQTCVMSLLTFTGASQFTFVSVLPPEGRPRRGCRRRCCWPPATGSTRSACATCSAAAGCGGRSTPTS